MSTEAIMSPQHAEMPAESPFKKAFKEGLVLPITDPPSTDVDPSEIVAPPSKPAPAAKPAAPVEFPDLDMPGEIKSEAGKKTWKTWKETHDVVVKEKTSLAEERDRLKQELAAAKTARAPDPEEIKTLREQLEETRVKLRMKDVEADPEWHNTFVRPVLGMVEQAKNLVPAELQKQVELALASSNFNDMATQLEEIAESSGLSQVRVAQLANLAAQVVQIRSAAELRKQDSATLVKEYDAHVITRQQANAKQQMEQGERIFSSRGQELAKTDPVFGDPEVQKQARQVLFGANTAEDLADAGYYSALGKRSAPELATLRSENKKLSDELARLTAGRPSGNAAGAATGGGGEALVTGKTFSSVFKELTRQGG